MDENSLDGLIAKIKSEAIEGAEKEAQDIINEAKAKARMILKEAEVDKHQLIETAQQEAYAIVKKGNIALQQAARDVHISVKNDLIELFKLTLEGEVNKTFSPELYSSVISNIIETIETNVTITIPENVAEDLSKDLKNKISQSNGTVKLIEDKQLFSGLSVSKTDEGWSYNITAEEVSELLSQHLSQKWIDILKEN